VTTSFDSLPHDELLKSVARRIVDRHMLRLIKLWLKARSRNGIKATGPGASVVARATCVATPQGGVASPLLANVYMNRFLKYWRLTACGKRSAPTSSRMLTTSSSSVADVRLRLWRGRRRLMTRLGLTLNETKTSLKNARQDRFDFLGYSFGPHRYKANGNGI